MDDKSRQDPMTEIALALAMGFFSVMVLSVVSLTAEPAADAMRLAADSANRARNDEGRLVIYYGGRFLDDRLQPVDTATLASSTSGDTPIVLGTSPLLSIGEAMDARSRIDHERVVVTRLSPEWMERLTRGTR